jgi:branched-chain amino acid transport system ATP-binding protein
MTTPLLEARSITMQFGGLKAVDSLQFHIQKGELMGLIGPNGAGKTTVFNMLTGVYQPTHGEVIFDGASLKGLKPWQVSHRGMTRTFQNIRLFKELSVLDNVLIAANQQVRYGFFAPVLKTQKFLKQEANLRDEAMDLLRIFHLEKKALDEAGSLPYGEQRKLEIIRALATKPKLICLDEPAAGMNHNETHSLMETIAKIRKDFNLTVLLIEHDMKLVMGICERIVVLDHGTKIEEGNPEKIQSSKRVIEAYLGTDEDLQGSGPMTTGGH